MIGRTSEPEAQYMLHDGERSHRPECLHGVEFPSPSFPCNKASDDVGATAVVQTRLLRFDVGIKRVVSGNDESNTSI